MANKGAFIRFEAPEMKPQFTKFGSVVSLHFLHHLKLVLAVCLLLQDYQYFCLYFGLSVLVSLFVCSIVHLLFVLNMLMLQWHPNVRPMAYANNFFSLLA